MISYDPETGFFYRKFFTQGHGFGVRADQKGPKGYLEIRIQYKKQIIFRKLAHVVAYAYSYGNYSNKLIDHINRNKQDNRIENLREVSYIQNANNSKSHNSLPKGIKLTKNGKYQASITMNYITHHIGTYDTIGEAESARLKAEADYMLD